MKDPSNFYATTAQVLPLFVLALAAERRLGVTKRSTDPTIDAVIGLALIASAAIGELAAFNGLVGQQTHQNRVAAELGLAFAGVFLFADLVWAQVRGHEDHNPATWRRRSVRGAALTLVAAAAALVFLTYLAAL